MVNYQNLCNMANKTNFFFRKIDYILPGASLITAYKSFTRPHPVGTRYCNDISFLLDFHRDIDRLRIDTEGTSLYTFFNTML